QIPTSIAFRGADGMLVYGDGASFGFAFRGIGSQVGYVHPGVHGSSVSQVCFCPNDELLTASWDGTFKLWPRQLKVSATELAIAQAELPPVISAAVAPSGGWIVAGYHDGRVRVWEMVHPGRDRILHMHSNVVQFI